MTYTTQQLQAMSDFEVNKALAEKLGAEKTRASTDCASTVEIMDVSGVWIPKNYCNNPLGVMALQFARGISINFCPHLNAWTASVWKKTGKMESTMVNSFRCDTNPLRAIACLLLMMED